MSVKTYKLISKMGLLPVIYRSSSALQRASVSVIPSIRRMHCSLLCVQSTALSDFNENRLKSEQIAEQPFSNKASPTENELNKPSDKSVESVVVASSFQYVESSVMNRAHWEEEGHRFIRGSARRNVYPFVNDAVAFGKSEQVCFGHFGSTVVPSIYEFGNAVGGWGNGPSFILD